MAKKDPKDLKYGVGKTLGNESAYQVELTRKLYYRPTIYINKEQYADMIAFLKSKPSISEYIISLILADMNKGKR